MLVIISPAKTLDFISETITDMFTLHVFYEGIGIIGKGIEEIKLFNEAAYYYTETESVYHISGPFVAKNEILSLSV